MVSFLGKILGISSNAVKNVGDAVDKISTTKDEKNAKANERLKIDANTESLLTRSIRPLILLLFTIFFFVSVFFKIPLNESQSDIVKLVFQYAIPFYFGGRLIEKIVRGKAK